MKPQSDSTNEVLRAPLEVLQQAVCLIAGQTGSQQVLSAIFALLHEQLDAQLMTLQLGGNNRRKLIFGEEPGVPANEANSVCYQSVILPLTGLFIPTGTARFVLPNAEELEHQLLVPLVALISQLLGQEQLLKRAEDAEARSRQRISEVAAIYEIGQAIDQIALPELLELITRRAAALMDAQTCSLMLVVEANGSLRIAASHGLPPDALYHEQRLGEGIAGKVAATDEPMLIVGDLPDPRLKGVALKPEISSSMLVPMKGQSGEVLGVLCIRRRQPARYFTEEDLKLFSVFASQAGLAVTNVRLYEDQKRRAIELEKLSSLSRMLISTLKLDDLLDRIADEVLAVVGFERCCIYMRGQVRQIFQPQVLRGYPESVAKNSVKEGDGAVGMAARSRQTIFFDNSDPLPENIRDKSYLQMKGYARSLGVDAIAIAPLLTSQNQCVGVLVADNRMRHSQITQEQKNLLSAFVNQAGIVIEHIRLYDEVHENYRNIHRLKNYTDNVLLSIGAGIISTDSQNRVVRWNRAAEETLKLSGEQLRNSSLARLFNLLQLPDAERAELERSIDKVMETGERANLRKRTFHPLGRSALTLDLMLSRLVDHNQEKAGVVLIFEDVTQQIRLEAEVEKMRRLADIGQLAARMAHEVRNALSPIKGAAQILRSEAEAVNASTEWADIIVAEVEGLSGLTSEMLDFARPKQLALRSLNVNDFLSSAILMLSIFLQEHHVSVHWRVSEDLPELLADPVQLGQLVRNIVMNAAQAMPDGGKLTISSESDSNQEHLILSFSDTGIGIAEEDLDRIFRPFVTTRTKGTGLGLPIVQKIVDHHGGQIEVESRLGKGTTFVVRLPLKAQVDGLDQLIGESPIVGSRPVGFYPDN